MPFVDLSEFLTENDLVIQGLGPRDYIVPAPDVERGLRYSALSSLAVRANRGEKVTQADLAALHLDDAQEREFAIEILTEEVVQQMAEDGLKWPVVTRTAHFAYVHFAISPEAAKKAFEAGVFSGKALTPPNRAARRTTQSARPASAASKRGR